MKKFSFDTVEAFDEHIDKSIVGYSQLTDDILAISDYFVEPDTNVYDIGCSTGKFIKRVAVRHEKAHCFGIEPNPNFTGGFKNEDNLAFLKKDIFQCQEMTNASFVTSIFTVQFTQQHLREKLIQQIYATMNYGSGFVMCEKMLSENSKIQDMMTFMYYDYKLQNFQPDEVLHKEKDLRQIMKLFTLKDNERLLRDAGFRYVESFWKRYLFTGLIAIK